jgi:hypothetical protein
MEAGMRRALALLLFLLSTLAVPLDADAQPPGGLPLDAGDPGPVVKGPGQHDVSPALRHLPPSPPGGVATMSRFRTKRWTRLPRSVRAQAHVTADPVVQNAPGVTSPPSTSENFEGISSDEQAAALGLVVLPPDTTAAVGPDHIVQWVNISFAVYDKSGNRLYGPAAGNTVWQGFGGPCEVQNDGDPVVLYDHLADRWLLSQLAVPNFPDGPFYQCVAVSQSGDPLGAYYRYAYVISDTYLNDYPKLGVWPDGYYLAVNHFSCYDIIPPFGIIACDWAGQGVYAFERSQLLQGLPGRMVGLRLPTDNLGGMLPSHLQGPVPPPDGTPNYFVQVDDDAWLPPGDPYGPDTDRLQVWAFQVSWEDPPSSTFTQVGVLPTEPFDSNMCGYSPNCIPQPGVDILNQPSPPVDALADRLMYRLQYRNFGTHQLLVTNHTVDVDGADRAGIRWYELRNLGGGWEIHQQGTYGPDDGVHRWMGSVAVDGAGNMALGFSAGNLTVSPSIRYVGRLAGDPVGEMGTEASIVAGSGYQLDSSGRWGDYSTMDIDPTDDCTFWYTQEYYQTADIFYGRNWQTRIASLRFPNCGSGLSIGNATVVEGHGGPVEMTFTVTLSEPSTQTVTVDFATADGTAVAGSDYQATSGTLTFSPGQTAQTITVLVNGDALNEPDETVLVNLTAATHAAIAGSQGVGLIVNDDPVPALSVGDVTVGEGQSGTTSALFTVSLSAASGQTVTVGFATANGTAAAGSDYQATSGTLTFSPGQTARTITVLVNGDATSEPDETFTVNLSGAVNATIADGQGSGTITNDDGTPQLSINDVASTEGNTGSKGVTFTVMLAPPSSVAVTVDWATGDNTAEAGSDYTAAAGSLTFAPGETAKPVTVQVTGETLVEPDETFFVTLSDAANALIADAVGIGTIVNDDAAPPAASLRVTSPNGGEVWRVNRRQNIRWTSTGLTGPVQIELSRSGGASWEVLFASTPNDGRESWRVTGPPTTQGVIRVCAPGGAVCDQSDAVFTIR